MTLVEQVRAHALAHYSDGGWDVIVECWSTEDITQGIHGATTLHEAIAELQPVIDVWADRQADADQYRDAAQ